MLSPEFLRRMTAKHQAANEAANGTEIDSYAYEPPELSGAKGKAPVQSPVRETTSRARKAADTRMLNQHGRTREEIDALIIRDYRAKGPTRLAKELGMKVTTVMMRARRMSISADPYLASLRRLEGRTNAR